MEFLIKHKSKWIGFICGLLFIIIVLVGMSYKNINYQSVATIDYVYARMHGEDPSVSDTWLAEQYCSNKIGLKIAYPEMEEKCAVIMSQSGE